MLYRRILIKISGEYLGSGEDLAGGGPSFFWNHQPLHNLREQIQKLHNRGVEIVLVLGGGNILRGRNLEKAEVKATTRDRLGMLSTVMNGTFMACYLEGKGLKTRLMTAFPVGGVETFQEASALRALKSQEIVICAGGLGLPFLTTDTAAVVRGRELQCQCVLKGTQVDGIFDKDPLLDPDATFLPTLSYQACLDLKIGVMDQTAFALAREEKMPLIIFNLSKEDRLWQAAHGEGRYTLVS